MSEPDEKLQARGGDMETCGKCMGSGYGGHPDSGALCPDCNGSGGYLDEALAALAKLGAGDGWFDVFKNIATEAERVAAYEKTRAEAAEAEAAALTAQLAEAEREAESRSAMFATACEERNAAEAEAAALRERVARLEGVLTDMPKAVLRTTICQGPAWPDDRPGVWLAALEACAKSVQAAVDAALTDGGSNE